MHSPLMRSIHPQNFISIASIVLEICSGQKSSMKVNKGNNSKKANKSYGSCALHPHLMRSIHPQNFIAIASIVLEICSRQNLRLKKKKKPKGNNSKIKQARVMVHMQCTAP